MPIRRLTDMDQPVLWDILYYAIHVEPGSQPPSRDIVNQPELAHYVAHFGQQAGDVGVIAKEGTQPMGAAWVRLMRGYGFVDDETPELTIAVLPAYQGRGIGTQLLERLFAEIGAEVRAVSLSVTWTNPARHLYKRFGFELVTLENGTATMCKLL